VNPALILASGSPRRRELLALLGLPFGCRVADIDESPLRGESPADLVRRLSLAKAQAIAKYLNSDSVVAEGSVIASGSIIAEGRILASDTVVVLGDRILGKPRDEDEATRMLRELRTAPHHVLTGYALWDAVTGRHMADLAATHVWMRDYTDVEIAAYVASGDPMDKAGAYAIQHPEFRPVARIEGCYASVMGLPLCHLHRALRQWGATLPHTPVLPCRELTGHHCRIHQGILGDSTGDER
jgi:septum formation protein